MTSGEDLLDPAQIKFLSSPTFYAMNLRAFLRKWRREGGERVQSLEQALARARMRQETKAHDVHAGYRLGETSIKFMQQVEEGLHAACEYYSGRAGMDPDRWREVMLHKYQSALRQPGEAVGLLAAQVCASTPAAQHSRDALTPRPPRTVGG